jgi:predicted transcriptional regulator
MAGRKVLAITERQFAVLRVLWERGPLSARALMAFLPRGERQPYTTVLGLLQVMEKEGLVDHEKQGAVHVYRAAVSRQEGTGNLLSDFLAKFFHGSAEQLIVGLVDGKKLTPDELSAIEARLAAGQGARDDGVKNRAGKRRKRP